MRKACATVLTEQGRDQTHKKDPSVKDGLDRWAAIESRLPALLAELRAAQPMQHGSVTVPRAPGVYLFSEHDRPVYVGQTRNLRRRLAQHTGAWARENQATFAFNRARDEAALDPTFNPRRTRKELAGDSSFRTMFSRARERVAAMSVRFVEVDDPELRTVFEVYASVALGTENTFETH